MKKNIFEKKSEFKCDRILKTCCISGSHLEARMYRCAGSPFANSLKEETFASGKIRQIFGINFRELAAFCILARINFREFMI